MIDPSIYYCGMRSVNLIAEKNKCVKTRTENRIQKSAKSFGILRRFELWRSVYRPFARCRRAAWQFLFNFVRDCNIFKLFKWVIIQTVPLFDVVDALMWGIMNITAMYSKSLDRYILSLVPLVDYDIKEELSGNFGVMFDGWPDSSIYYVVMFCVYIHKG